MDVGHRGNLVWYTVGGFNNVQEAYIYGTFGGAKELQKLKQALSEAKREYNDSKVEFVRGSFVRSLVTVAAAGAATVLKPVTGPEDLITKWGAKRSDYYDEQESSGMMDL